MAIGFLVFFYFKSLLTQIKAGFTMIFIKVKYYF